MTAGQLVHPWSRIMRADGVLLRRPTEADAPGVFAVHGDPRVYAHDPQETHPDVEHTARFLAPMIAHWGAYGFGYWSVLVPAPGWPEGVRGGSPEDGDRLVAGLGGIQCYAMQGVTVLNVYFRFAVAAQGRGLARTVMEEALALAPLVAPGMDVVVRTRPANVVARRVAERAGFVDEGLEPGTTNMQLLCYPGVLLGGERRTG